MEALHLRSKSSTLRLTLYCLTEKKQIKKCITYIARVNFFDVKCLILRLTSGYRLLTNMRSNVADVLVVKAEHILNFHKNIIFKHVLVSSLNFSLEVCKCCLYMTKNSYLYYFN